MVDTTRQLDYGGNDLIVNDIFIGATAPGQTGTDITTTDLTALAGVTPGTAAASKAVILGASKNVATITSATITTLTSTTANATTVNAGADAVAGTVAIFPTTTATGKTTLTASSNSGATTTNINTAAQAGTRTLTVPDAGASTANFVLSTGSSTATTATSTELNTVSGVTPGTVIASKALVADSGIKISGLLNSTFGAGTATVAPINLTSGTNLTTAAAGAIEYDGTCIYGTAAASARQNLVAEQFIRQVADSSAANNTGLDTNTAAAVFTSPASGAITVLGTQTYGFEAEYYLTNTGTTSHTWAVLFGGNATFTSINYSVLGQSTGTANTPATGALSGFSTVATAVVATPASTSATEQVLIRMRGVMRTNAAGTVIPQLIASARPGASGTPGVVVKAGSFFRCWPKGSATVASVGNWS